MKSPISKEFAALSVLITMNILSHLEIWKHHWIILVNN